MPQIPLRTPADCGALIRDRRRALALDQAALAQMIGVSRLWVNQVERGKPGASLGLVLRALNALGVGLLADMPDRTTVTAASPVAMADLDAIVADARRLNRP
jgi:HTH-type transcriptional regulator/antitoxin HipB